MKPAFILLGTALAMASLHPADARPSKSYSQASSFRSSSYSAPRASVRVMSTPSGYGASTRTTSTPYPRSASTRAQDNAFSGSSLSGYLSRKQATASVAPSSTASAPRTSFPAQTPPVVASNPPAVVEHHHYHNDSSGDFLTGMVVGGLMSHHDQPAQQTVIVQQPQAAPPVSDYPHDGVMRSEPDVNSPSLIQQVQSAASPPAATTGQHKGSPILFGIFIVFLFSVVPVYYLFFRKKSAASAISASSAPLPRLPVILGSSVSLPVLSLMSDTATPGAVPLHFELAGDGRQSIVGVGEYSGHKSFYDAYFTADGSLEDFIQVRGDETRVMSFIDSQNPGSDAEWDMWLNDDSGLIGMPTFSTPDGVDWSRCVLPNSPVRISPEKYSVDVTTSSGKTSYDYVEMLYRRETGYRHTGPTIEYLLVRLETWTDNGQDMAVINIYAGADVEKTALDLMC